MTVPPGGSRQVVRWDPRDGVAPTLRSTGPGTGGVPVAPLGASGFVLLDGALYDRGRLGGAAGCTDADLAAAAWARWGDGALARLRGAFALVVWDADARRLVAARDAAGLGSCFFRWDGRLLLVSPSLDDLLAEPEVSGDVNREVIAEYLADDLAAQGPDETFYRDVRRLPPGHSLSLDRGGLAVSRYWDPLPAGFPWATPDEAAEFPTRLEQAMARCLDAGADSIALSGGLDSVGLAVVAAGLRGGRPPLHAISLRFDEPSCDEGDTQRAVARALGMPQTIARAEDLAGSGTVSAALALSATSPSPVLSPWQGLYVAILRGAAARGLGRIVMGTGGDELLNVDLTHGADCLARLELGGLWRLCRAWQRTSPNPAALVARTVLWKGAGRPVLRGLGRSALERVAPGALARRRSRREPRVPWLAPDRALAAALAERAGRAPRATAGTGDGAYAETLRRLLISPLALLELDQGHALDGPGRLPPAPAVLRPRPARSRPPAPSRSADRGRADEGAAAAAARRAPARCRAATRKVDFGRALHRLLRPELRRAWPAMRGARALADLGIVEPASLDRLMGRYLAGDDALGMRAWLLLSTEAWLRARCGERRPVLPEEVPA